MRQLRPVNVTVNYPQAAGDPSGHSGDTPAGLLQLIAKVFDQLSLTAWLPAALLVANTYLIVAMRWLHQPGTDPSMEPLKDAVRALDERPIGVLLTAVAGVVLVTLVTQSLEFVCIRFLEGYWGGSMLAALPTRAGIQLQRLRLKLLDRRAEKVERKAFAAVLTRVSRELEDKPELASAVILFGTDKPTAHIRETIMEQAEGYYHRKAWMAWAPADLRHRANSLSNRRSVTYPSERSRFLPTRLGNALRSSEDNLSGGNVAGARMRGYLYEHLNSIGPALMEQHNQYRNRLDMYAVMTVLTMALAIVNVWALRGVLPEAVVIWAAVGFAGLSYFSYRGAISSATDYGSVLLAMDRTIGSTDSRN